MPTRRSSRRGHVGHGSVHDSWGRPEPEQLFNASATATNLPRRPTCSTPPALLDLQPATSTATESPGPSRRSYLEGSRCVRSGRTRRRGIRTSAVSDGELLSRLQTLTLRRSSASAELQLLQTLRRQVGQSTFDTDLTPIANADGHPAAPATSRASSPSPRRTRAGSAVWALCSTPPAAASAT